MFQFLEENIIIYFIKNKREQQVFQTNNDMSHSLMTYESFTYYTNVPMKTENDLLSFGLAN